jgi:hypothetical protein
MTHILQNLKCYFGFHGWRDTGIRRMYGLIWIVECSHCKRVKEFHITDFDFIAQHSKNAIESMRKPR